MCRAARRSDLSINSLLSQSLYSLRAQTTQGFHNCELFLRVKE
jgi:hypothetical protein